MKACFSSEGDESLGGKSGQVVEVDGPGSFDALETGAEEETEDGLEAGS